MHSSNAEDRPSSYALSGEMELEIGLKFMNQESAMLATKTITSVGVQSISVARVGRVSVRVLGVLQEGLAREAEGNRKDLWTIVDLQMVSYYVRNTLDRDSVMFYQVFWLFPSCVQAFRHCKPLVLVDGTHLYGKYAGTLLMGIAQDGNNNILPVAFALVERENTDAWYFFLTNLRRHIATRLGVLLISDKHAAIKAALEREGCGWEHNVYYVRHIASNFTTSFKSKEAKRHLVNVAYSKTQEQAQYYLELVSSEDPVASPQMMGWIRGLEPPKWLQHLDEGRRYGHMMTNLSECINSVLKGTRNLPVCAIVKSTYHRLNELFVVKGRQAQAQIASGQVFSQFLQKAILANREGIFQMLVTSYDRATTVFTVDDIAAVGALHYPCAHALVACAYARLEWQQYVDLVYRVESMFRVYEMEFQPMPDEEMWPPYEGACVHPNPLLRRTLEGRSVSTRIRNEMDEVEPGPGKRCGLCRQPGHTR
ncbi:uncharacterized protein LOC107490204 [Arachis duranensis]|uniref:Uncharacterized protein LOC107490204 n=1 Tax=Arachis duranensis TaxID=130453 RepID=A0A6P4DDF4_ARADU|nr:uncharacterized protein LOC107490204 [Arachis duranensis]